MTTDTIDQATVWVVEDHDLFRQTLKSVLDKSGRFHCPQAFSTSEDALRALEREEPPDVILLDIELPGMDGVTAIPLFKRASPGIQIVIQTVHDDNNTLYRAYDAGALGYMLKSDTRERIFEAIDDVLIGGASLNRFVTRKTLEMITGRKENDYGLTPRELQILRMYTRGGTKKSLSEDLHISSYTVDAHTRHIYRKLKVHSKSEAIAIAIMRRL